MNATEASQREKERERLYGKICENTCVLSVDKSLSFVIFIWGLLCQTLTHTVGQREEKKNAHMKIVLTGNGV